MTKQKIILLLSGLGLLLIGFGLAVYFSADTNSKTKELVALELVTKTQTPAVAPQVDLVPPYVPVKVVEPTPPPIPAGAKVGSKFVLTPTKAAEVISDQATGVTTKIININIGQNISPDKIYLNRGDIVSLKITNQQATELNLVSTDKTKMADMKIAAGESQVVAYDTSKPSDFILICQTCTPPKPLSIKVLVGGAVKK